MVGVSALVGVVDNGEGPGVGVADRIGGGIFVNVAVLEAVEDVQAAARTMIQNMHGRADQLRQIRKFDCMVRIEILLVSIRC